MSGGLQYVTTANFFPYTPIASTAAAGFPVTQLGDWTSTHPVARGWQSTTTLAQAISCNFGSSKNGTWVALLGANFATVHIGIGNGTTFTDITGAPVYVPRTIPQDPADPESYRKLFLPVAYTGPVGRLEIPTQATTDGAPGFNLGLVLWGNSLVTMSHYFHDPLVEDFIDPEFLVEGKDWRESFPAGIRSKTLTIRNTFRNSEAPEWHALRQLRPGTRLLAYMNQDNQAETYVCERNRPVTITKHGGTQEVNTGLRVIS